MRTFILIASFILFFFVLGCIPQQDTPETPEPTTPKTEKVVEKTPEEPEPTPEQTLPKLPPGRVPELSGSLLNCRYDDECVIVTSGCCNCNNGGGAVAIHEEYAENWKNGLEQKCTDIACPTVISTDWTCTAQAKCIKNKCTLIKP